jgi:REP element-mobilizing transposase RayT
MNPLRSIDPDKIYHITDRTVNEELWMLPTIEIERTIGGIVARFQEMHQILIYGLEFLSNHYHLLAQSPYGNLSEFEQDINREIAKRINRHCGRSGSLWARRFSSQPTPREVDGLDALLYVTTNPVHHGLVNHPRLWPGLSSYWQLLGGRDREYTFTNYTALNLARARSKGKKVKIKNFQTKHTLKISPLPMFADLSKEERVEKLNTLIEERTQRIVDAAKENGTGFLGKKKIMEQKFGSRPRSVKRSPRPSCFSKCPETVRAYRKDAKALREEYTEASIKYRSGEWDTEFPKYTYRPPAHRHPRYHELLRERVCGPP